jgi:hypothetical protein
MRPLSLLILLALNARAADLGSVTGAVYHVGTNQPVAGAIVYLGAGSGGTPVTNAVVEVRDGVLQPHVQVTGRTATLVLRNTDPTLRVVRIDVLNSTNAPVRVLTQAMPYAGFQKAFALEGFRDTTLLRVTGGNGEEMAAYVAVLPHPWTALTDEGGHFTIAGIPAGTYKLFVWHEALGVLTRDVRVPANRATTADLTFTP